MGVRMMDLLSGNLDALRYEPTAKRVRVSLAGEPVADTEEARLVWEPRRVVPTYAVPAAALTAQLVPAGAESGRVTPLASWGPTRCGGRGLPAAGPQLPPGARPVDPVRRAHLPGHRVRRHRRRGDGRSRGVSARRPRPRRLRHPRVRRVRVARGGRADRQPSARSVRPHRCAAQQPPRPDRTRRQAAGRVVAADAVVRDAAPGPVLSAARGRRGRGSNRAITASLLRIQGPRAPTSRCPTVRGTWRGPTTSRCTTPNRVRDRICFFDEHFDVTVDGRAPCNVRSRRGPP